MISQGGIPHHADLSRPQGLALHMRDLCNTRGKFPSESLVGVPPFDQLPPQKPCLGSNLLLETDYITAQSKTRVSLNPFYNCDILVC